MDPELEAKIAARYRQASTEQPPAALDARVLAAARDAVRPRAVTPFGNHWFAGAAMAAVVVLSVLLVVLMPPQPAPVLPEPAAVAPQDRPATESSAVTAELAEQPAASTRRQADSAAPARAAKSMAQPQSRDALQAPARELRREVNGGADGNASAYSADAASGLQQKRAALPMSAAPVTAGVAPESSAVAPPAAEAEAIAGRLADDRADRQQARPEPVPSVAAPLYLQAGQFADRASAEAVRARIEQLELAANVSIRTLDALPGLQAVPGLYQVRIGPFTEPDALAKVRERLSRDGIETTLLPL